MFHRLHGFLCARPASRRRTSKPRLSLRLERLEDRTLPALVGFEHLSLNPDSYDSSSILVRLRPGIVDPDALQVLDGTQFGDALSLVPGLWEVRLADGVSVESALAAYAANPFVLSASPNFQLQVSVIPNDSSFSSLWGLHNTGQTGGAADADIDAPEAWDVFTGSAAVLVAVIDTGIDYTHPDLAANIWTNPGEVAGDGIDNDGNGFVDDVHGYDFHNNDANPMDDNGHGTHVAGTIGAVGNNNLGVTGVNWNVRMMALKVFDSSGSGLLSNAIRALNYAVQMGAVVSNNSYGASGQGADDPLFLEAIQNAAGFGHIFVAAAGNASSDNDAQGTYPANFDVDNVISVAATDQSDQLAYFSNYGATTVDLAAPGVDILSTKPGADYQSLSGTSMATPHVTGVVALVRGLHPDWDYRQVIDQILNSVDYVPGLEGRVITAGRLNAARALLDVDGPYVVATNPSGGVGGIVSSIRVSFNEPVDAATFTVADAVSFTGPNGPIQVTGVNVVAGSFNRKFDITFAPQITRGAYELVLGPEITDGLGNAMDQDGDGTLGEIPDDRYTATFIIGDQYVFNSTDTPKTLASFAVTSSTMTVNDDLSIADLDVRINISSLDVGFLDITLVSPAGTSVSLAPMTGDSMGPEFRNTVFDDEATGPLSSGSSPYTGSFTPAASLSALDNQSTKGNWRLDVLSLFGGMINSWSLLVVANPPRLTIADLAFAEGNSGTTEATFTVRLSNVIDQPVTVDYATGGGTATPGSDYEPNAGTLTFNPGELVKTITIAVHGDTVDEPDETFLVTLSGATNANITDGEAVGTIRNDEVVVSVSDATLVETNSGTVNAAFTVSLASPSNHSVTVNYATAPGTATAATDYVTSSGSLTFAPGELSKTLLVGVKGDTRYESNETFFVNLTVTDAWVLDGQGVGTITNDDPVPLLSVNDLSITEGESGTKSFNFGVTLSTTTDDTVTVNYATADDAALAGSDYTAASGTLTFTPGQSLKSVTVTVSGDSDLEPSETFFLNLSNPSKALLFDAQGQGTILADEVSLLIDDVTVVEGDGATFAATFTVSLTQPAPFDVTMSYATAGSTASAGSDFVSASGTLVFAAGETSKSVTVLGIGDVRDEADETFFLNLSAPVNAMLGDAQGRATIQDDDLTPTVSVVDATVVEGNSGTRNLSFTVKLSAVSGRTVTLNYATADGSATVADGDYQARSGTLSIGAGSTTQNVSVPINVDTVAETDETLFFNLSSAVNAIIDDGEAVGTIQDDDSLVVDDISIEEGDAGTATAVFTVRLLAPRQHTVTVNYATANSTASASADYLATSGTLTFLAGETMKNVSVTVIGEHLNEADEVFFLNLTNPTGALIADTQGRATLINDDSPPTVTVADAWIIEGHSGTKNLSFVLQLSAASGQYISVSYATADGTATLAGNDYQARSGTAGFSIGMTTQTINVPVVGDTTAEGEEQFYLNLTGASNAVIADDQAVGTIYDDEPLPVAFVGDKSAAEGNVGTSTVYYTVSLSAASTQIITVQFATADGTAAAGSDYVAKSELLTFTPGQTYKQVGVTVNGDATAEPSETVFVTLSSPTNVVLGDAQAIGTLLNDDTTLQVNDLTVAEGNDGITTAVFTVSLTGPLTTDPVRVNYATANSTGVGGADYVSISGTLVFAPGQTSATVTVPVLGDLTSENNEAFFLNLSGAVNATIADSQGVATIVDATDPIPSLSVADVTIIEGNSGTRNLNFVVTLSAASGKVVTVSYATANGSAVAGADYQAKSGTLSFSAGSLSQTVSVPLTLDTVAETDETFFLNLLGAANATISDSQAVGTIQDDDSLVVDDIAVTEGDGGTRVAQFTVRLLAPRTDPVTVNYATANGGAAAGSDYLAAAGALTFAPGQTAQTIEVVVVGDRFNEAAETFYLNLSNASGALIADAQGLATIANDDPQPSISASNVTVSEGNAGAKNLTLTLRLSEASGQSVSMSYATADGTATVAGLDYVPRSGSVTINAGQVSTTVSVTVNGDMAIEGNEYFYFNLSNPTNATLTTTQVRGTIFDDDSFGFGSSVGGSSGPSIVGGTVRVVATDHAKRTNHDYQMLLDWADRQIAADGGPSDFSAPSNRGEQNRMDLLSVVMREVGQALRLDDDEDGVMTDTLMAGRRMPLSHCPDPDTSVLASDALFALFATDDDMSWFGGAIFGRGRKMR